MVVFWDQRVVSFGIFKIKVACSYTPLLFSVGSSYRHVLYADGRPRSTGKELEFAMIQ